MTTSSYYFPKGSTTAQPGSKAYSWSSRDGNQNYSLTINEKASDGPEMVFSQTERVSHKASLEVANQITDSVKKAEALAALQNDPSASIAVYG